MKIRVRREGVLVSKANNVANPSLHHVHAPPRGSRGGGGGGRQEDSKRS